MKPIARMQNVNVINLATIIVLAFSITEGCTKDPELVGPIGFPSYPSIRGHYIGAKWWLHDGVRIDVSLEADFIQRTDATFDGVVTERHTDRAYSMFSDDVLERYVSGAVTSARKVSFAQTSVEVVKWPAKEAGHLADLESSYRTTFTSSVYGDTISHIRTWRGDTMFVLVRQQ